MHLLRRCGGPLGLRHAHSRNAHLARKVAGDSILRRLADSSLPGRGLVADGMDGLKGSEIQCLLATSTFYEA